jgi:hypothetical protein
LLIEEKKTLLYKRAGLLQKHVELTRVQLGDVEQKAAIAMCEATLEAQTKQPHRRARVMPPSPVGDFGRCDRKLGAESGEGVECETLAACLENVIDEQLKETT